VILTMNEERNVMDARAGQDREAQGGDRPAQRDNAKRMKSEDKQISLTDPDARSMATSGKDTGIWL